MAEETPRGTPPDEDVVRIDGRAIPFQAWEHELMLRSVAWVALVQGAVMAYVAGARWLRTPIIAEEWPVVFVVGVIAVGLMSVRSRVARSIVAATGVVCFVTMVCGGEFPTFRSTSSKVDLLVPFLAGVAYAVAGGTLLWRRTLARDVLLALSCAWLLVVGPGVIEALSNLTTFSQQTANPYAFYGMTSHPFEPTELMLVAAAWLLPPAFVLLTMLSRAGRSLFVEDATHSRLAPFTSLRKGPPTARGWAAFIVLLLTLLGSAFTLEQIGKLVRRAW